MDPKELLIEEIEKIVNNSADDTVCVPRLILSDLLSKYKSQKQEIKFLKSMHKEMVKNMSDEEVGRIVMGNMPLF